MMKLKPNSRLGQKQLAKGKSLTIGSPFDTPKSLEDTDDAPELPKLHFARGDYLVVTDGKYAGTKGVALWVGMVGDGVVRVGVKPLKAEMVMVDASDVRKEEGRIG